ncbi:MAG: methyltransferase domain-containing protein, partial [Chloroflexi bacterium]
MNARPDQWDSGATYESYVGRWSRLVAREFLHWLDLPAGSRWLDVGCGTGALSEAVLHWADPGEVKGIDRSAGFVAYAREHITDSRASFEVADAQQLPVESSRYDAVVSGLVVNFIPDTSSALQDMARAARPGGVIAAYVWDYADGMQMLRIFWDAVNALHPEALDLDEGRRFPLCRPGPLGALFREAGLDHVEVRSIEVRTHFRDFDDYWTPFLGRTGAAPTYLASVGDEVQEGIRLCLQSRLAPTGGGPIELTARASAVQG